MKKLLFLLITMIGLLPSICNARNVHYRYPYHSCVSCGTYNAHKHWHNEHGWWLPVGMIVGAALATSYQERAYQGYPPVVVQQPVYYVPRNQQYIIIRDTNYPNLMIYQYY